ncbi:unnamed protein product [Gordionus sp. m RMFG-2023]|uniref:uncharacterized protein LOC135923685 n=1 Tax=Gordionus sp. m RMFG-2023 TaxID=3053472 RepID=UPI0030E0275A
MNNRDIHINRLATHNTNIFRRFLFFNHSNQTWNNNSNNNGTRRGNSRFFRFASFKNYALLSITFYLILFSHRYHKNNYQYALYSAHTPKSLDYNDLFPFILGEKHFINFFTNGEHVDEIFHMEPYNQKSDILSNQKNIHKEPLLSDTYKGNKNSFYDFNFFKFPSIIKISSYKNKDIKNENNINVNNELSNHTSSETPEVTTEEDENDINNQKSIWRIIADAIIFQYSKRKAWSLRNIHILSKKIVDSSNTALNSVNIITYDANKVTDDEASPLNKDTFIYKMTKRLITFVFRSWDKFFAPPDKYKYKFSAFWESMELPFYFGMVDKLVFMVVRIIRTDYWISINTAYCCLILFAKIIHKAIFGSLRSAEQILLKDKICNFVFNKMIFMFGLLNVDNLGDFTLWTTWFSVTCFLHSTALLLKTRLDYLSLSPKINKLTKFKLGILLCALIIWANAITLAVILAYVQFQLLAAPVYLFLLYECMMLQLNTYHILYNVLVNVYDTYHTGCWESKNQMSYYGDLIFGVSILVIDLFYHVHMLLWGSIILSMASLFICMELRWLFGELKSKLIKHQNYLRIIKQMDKKYPMASSEEIEKFSNNCSICWDPMRRARKLPCDHLFHDSCLRSWLEHDSSCPICRRSLNTPPQLTNNRNITETHNANLSTQNTNSLINTDNANNIISDINPSNSLLENSLISSVNNATAPSSAFNNATNHTEGIINNLTRIRDQNNDNLLTRTLERLNAWNQRMIFMLLDFLFNASAALTLETNENSNATIGLPSPNNNINGLNVNIISPNSNNPNPTTNSTNTGISTNEIGGANNVTNGNNAGARVNRVNRFFHFDASRYISWLPTFSLQISHLRIHQTVSTNTPHDANMATTINSFLLDDMVRQVTHIFPHIPGHVIRSDLTLTWSVDRTVENILEGDLGNPYLLLDENLDDTYISQNREANFPSTDDTFSTNNSLNNNSNFGNSSNVNQSTNSYSSTSNDSESGEETDEAPINSLINENFNINNNRGERRSGMEHYFERYSSRGINSNSDSTSAQQIYDLMDECEFELDEECKESYPFVSYNGNFVDNSKERESMLEKRKKTMLKQAQRRYLYESNRCDENIDNSKRSY